MARNLLHGERDPGGFRPRILPPVWAGIVGAGMLVAARMTSDAPLAPIERWTAWCGIVLLILGSMLSTWSASEFVQTDTPIEPGRVSTALLATGPYRFSRNPIYLGMAIGLIGWAMFLRAPVTLIGPALFTMIIRWRFIRHEERMLTEQFGDAYVEYRARVRRWM